jgi:hypothetical protein
MDGLIRKIVAGRDPKTDGMAYSIGMRVGNGSICSILFDQESFDLYGVTKYVIYVQEPEAQVLWKTIENMPCVVEYDLNF